MGIPQNNNLFNTRPTMENLTQMVEAIVAQEKATGERHRTFHHCPIDKNDPDHALTAIELPFPKDITPEAQRVVQYFEGAAFLYFYKGKYVVTDEGLYLTEHGDGSHGKPFGSPRWTGHSLEEMERWLEEIAKEFDAEGDVPGWDSDQK